MGCLKMQTRDALPLVATATRAAGVPAPDIEQLLAARGESPQMAPDALGRKAVRLASGFCELRFGDPLASAGWVLSLRAPPRSAAPVDSIRKLHNPTIAECACGTGGTLPALALRGPLPPRHPTRLRPLAIEA
jgi:hypothetical protein